MDKLTTVLFVGSFLAVVGVAHHCTKNCMPQDKPLLLTVTAYRPIRAQTDSTPNQTSVMSPAIMGICAVSRDLLNDGLVKYGDLLDVDGLGVFKVMDTMNKRHRRHIDILVYTKAQEKVVGWRKNVLVRKVSYDTGNF